MDKFDEIYRIESARLKNWDYGSNAYYFVTICTLQRECFFGKVVDSKMIFNDIGNIARTIWNEISNQFPFVQLGTFVVMPNHIHGIIQIDKIDVDNNIDVRGRDAINRVSTAEETNRVSTIEDTTTIPNKPGGITGDYNPMLHKNLSRIIRWYKGRVTFESRKTVPNFQWQSRFHDRIIRDKNEWYAKTNYIKNNPKKWNDDEFYL